MTVSAAVSAHVVRIAGWRRMFRAVMLSAMALCAQSGDWAQVQALAPGAQVDVKRYSGGLVRGTVESASTDQIVIRTQSDTVTVDRVDARRLRVWSDQKTETRRIAGTAVGGTLGMLFGSVSDGKSGDGLSSGARAATLGVAAGVGYLIGWAKERPKRITIFRAPKP